MHRGRKDKTGGWVVRGWWKLNVQMNVGYMDSKMLLGKQTEHGVESGSGVETWVDKWKNESWWKLNIRMEVGWVLGTRVEERWINMARRRDR